MSLLSPSGGVVYHLRALRYRDSAWAPFRSGLSRWLERSLPQASELLLIGPSGGHCLPLEQLRRIGKLSVLEPDLLARRILAARLAPAGFEVEARDLLVSPLLQGRPGLDALLERRPRAAVLFCNVLGQVHLALSEAEHERFQSEFRRRWLPGLAGRAWASFHDRWSLDIDAAAAASPWLREAPPAASFDYLPSDAELGAAWFGSEGAPLTLLDHGTTELFPEDWPRHYLSWRLTPSSFHVIEAVSRAG